MTAPATIKYLVDENKLLYLYCRSCGHEKEVPPLSIGLPEDYPVPEVSKHLFCSQCGSKKIWSTGQLHPKPLSQMRGRSD